MDDHYVIKAADHFASQLNVDDSDAGARGRRTMIRALRALPEPERLLSGADGNDPEPDRARALALVGDLLIEIWAFKDGDGEYRTMQRTRSLSDPRASVEMEWGPLDRFDWGVGHETRWVFKTPEYPDVGVLGTVTASDDDIPDAADAFAREVAGRVGKPVSRETE
jgi:hypothetical protein